jgi:DMSO/TMAO reductase YedYZ heme-binding membrane subunit
MKVKTFVKILIGILLGIGYIIFSSAIQTTEYIWILTRVFGMLSILALFVVIFLGELKLLGINRFVKIHHLLGMTAFFLVFLHFISAIFEKSQWGINLSFVDHLGVNYSDKWMIFLSIGSLAFYLMILVSVTSAYSVMAKIGYKKWRLIHYISYLTLIFAFSHSIILGTEFNHSEWSTVYMSIEAFVFSTLLALFALRIGKVKFEERNKTIGFLVMIFIMSGGVAYAAVSLKTYSNEVALLKAQGKSIISKISDMEKINSDMADLNTQARKQIDDIKSMSANVLKMIDNARAAYAAAQAQAEAAEAAQAAAEKPQIQVEEPEVFPEEETNNNYYENGEYEDD